MGTIAPHEGKEVVMVMNGLKPFATIEFSKDTNGYSMAVSLCATGMLVGSVRPTADCEMGEIAFTKPSNRAMIDEYNTLLDHGVMAYGIKGYHRRMGELFGYDEADVEAFIESTIKCDCIKCNGRQLQ